MQSVEYKNLVPQLKEDLENFDLLTNLTKFRFQKDVNIKRIFYRSITLFVSALGRAYGLRQNSSFGIIDELKRLELINGNTAKRLSQAVAIACHIRLVHYSSKGRQEENIYEEDERYGGSEKLKQLTKYVNQSWLIESLVTSCNLQQVLQKNIGVLFFEVHLVAVKTFLRLAIMLSFGLHDDVIKIGESLLNGEKQSNAFDCYGLNVFCHAYIQTRQYKKCLEVIQRLRSNLPKQFDTAYVKVDPQTQKPVETVRQSRQTPEVSAAMELFFYLMESECLFYLGHYSVTLKLTDALLKLKLDPLKMIKCLQYNSKSKINLKKYREALSAIRDLIKLYRRESFLKRGTMDPNIWRDVSLCLLQIGRRHQGLHWAREGLNYCDKIQAVDVYVEEFMKLIKLISSNPSSNFEVNITPNRSSHSVSN